MFFSKFAKQDPLFHFAVGAVFLFALNFAIQRGNQQKIVLTPELRASITDQSEAMKGSKLTELETQNAIEDYVAQTIIFADAINLGLHEHATIRSTLNRRYRALLTAALPDPDDQALLQYYRDHIQDYTHPRLYDVEYHLLESTADLPVATHEAIGALEFMTWLNKPTQYQSHQGYSERDILMLYGKNIAEALPKAQLQQWVGPFSNFRGSFYFRVLGTHDGTVRPFEDVRIYVRDAWLKSRQDRLFAEKVQELKSNYRIEWIN